MCKMNVLHAIVLLLVIDLHSSNAADGQDDADKTTQPPAPENLTSTPIKNSSDPKDTSTSSPGPTGNPPSSNGDLTTASTTTTTRPTNDNSIEITMVKEKENRASENYKQRKSIVVEIIAQNSLQKSGNFFVLESLLNLSSTKYNVQPIGEPFDFTEYIEKLEIENQVVNFGTKDESATNFTNIRVSRAPSYENVTTFYNNFTCASRRIEIQLNMIPENMNFKSDYHVMGTNKTSSVTYIQTGGRLLYKISNASEIRDKDNLNLLKQHGDLVYTNGKMDLNDPSDYQNDIWATSAQWFKDCKKHILKEMDHTKILARIETIISAFPFLSICSSLSNASENLYVINNVVVKKYHSSNFQLGPMLLKGLDNFTDGKVIAMKSRVPAGSPNSFLVSTQANHIQGQCDWCYFKGNSCDSSVDNYSFSFVIEEIDFIAEVAFSESWNLRGLQMNLGQISIHRYDKNCPKIDDFTKCILQDFVRETVAQSLRDLFKERFPELIDTTTTSKTIAKKTTGTRQIVYWSPLPGSETEATRRVRDRLPLPTRRVFIPCKDTRKWWQKLLFYKNKCAKKNKEED